jgi:hypothetical protein
MIGDMEGGAGTLVGGRYLLAEPVGQGGMGRVWRAHDQLLDRTVAVKEVLLPGRAAAERADLVARMLREARAIARLDHPGVVTIYDVIDHDSTPWIVMRFVPGESLGQELARAGRLPWQAAASIGEQVADALAHAHAAGIVHRDLKPDNILLSGGRAIITDFGIARILDATTQLTDAGKRIGTVSYMAPEQLEDADAGPPADMWALGSTLYYATEGRLPFTGPTMTAVMAAILTRPPDPPRHANSLRELIEALLAKDPAERPDARTVASALADQRIRALASGFAADSDGSADRQPTGQAPPVPAVLADTQVGEPPSGPQPAATRQLTHETAVLSPPRPASLAAALAKAARSRPRLAIGAATATALAATLVVTLVVVAPQNSGQAARSVAASLSPIGTLSDPSGYAVRDVAFSPDGKTIAGIFDGTDGHLDLWDLASRHLTGPLSASSGSIAASGLAFDPGNAQSLAFGDSFGIELWNLAARQATTDSDNGNNDSIVDVAFTPDGKTLAAANADGNVGFFSVGTGGWSATTLQDPAIHDAWKTEPAQSLRQVAVSPSGTVFAVADSLGNVYVWNGTGGTPQRIRGTVTDSIDVLAFSPDSTLLAIASQTSVQLLNVATGTLSTLRGPGTSARAVAFSPQGTTLAVADAQGKIYLWRLATRSETAASVPAAPWAGLAFSPDGSVLAAFGLDGTQVYLYRVAYAAS